MNKWLSRLLVAGVLFALGFWGWRVFFPSPEAVIRKRLGELAKAASFSSNDGLLAKAWNVSILAEFFTPDVQVTLDVPGAQHTISGRDELLQAAVGARTSVSSLTVEFPDVKVTLAPDKETAVVNLTATSKVPGQRDFYLQELRVRMIKIKRDWLIDQVQTVKTLSLNNQELLTSGLCLGDPSRPCYFAALRFVEAHATFVPAPWGEAWVEGERTELPFLRAASAAVSRASHLVSQERRSFRPVYSPPGA